MKVEAKTKLPDAALQDVEALAAQIGAGLHGVPVRASNSDSPPIEIGFRR